MCFTSIGTSSDKLLLGTDRGTIHVYHLASLQFVAEIPYQMALTNKQALNSVVEDKIRTVESALHKLGPAVVAIELTTNMRFLKISYADLSFVMIDRTSNSPQQAIMGSQFGHFDCVTGLQWLGR